MSLNKNGFSLFTDNVTYIILIQNRNTLQNNFFYYCSYLKILFKNIIFKISNLNNKLFEYDIFISMFITYHNVIKLISLMYNNLFTAKMNIFVM